MTATIQRQAGAMSRKPEKLSIRTRLETTRLKLRLFTDQDLQIMFELNSDPEVIKYAESTPAINIQEARERLELVLCLIIKSMAMGVLPLS